MYDGECDQMVAVESASFIAIREIEYLAVIRCSQQDGLAFLLYRKLQFPHGASEIR